MFDTRRARTFNANNQETTGGLFGYNGDGSPWQYLNRNLRNAANPGGTRQIYSYTSLGQLRQVNAQNADGSAGAAVAFYGYRGDGKRAWKQSASGGVRTYFYYEGDVLIGSQSDAPGSSSAVYLWGADGLLGTQSRDALGTVRSSYFLYDTQGDLAQTVDGAGVVSAAASYTAWGEVVPRADGTSPGVGTLGYGAKFGYLRDGETGFYLATYRHYDPSAGRWITRDPIGYNGGSNLYGYVDNDPVNATDPSGLARVELRYWRLTEVDKAMPFLTGPLGQLIAGRHLAFYHAYIIVSENDGSKPYLFNGWKGNGLVSYSTGPGEWAVGCMGYLTAYEGDFDSGRAEYAGSASHPTQVFVNGDSKSAQHYINKFRLIKNSYNQNRVPYDLLGPNSNTVVWQMLDKALPGKMPYPIKSIPGFDNKGLWSRN